MSSAPGDDGGDESALLAQAHERARRLTESLLGQAAALAGPPPARGAVDAAALAAGEEAFRRATDAAGILARAMGEARRAGGEDS